MKRHPFAFEILMGEADGFRKTLGASWPQVTAFLDRNDIRNFSLWSCGRLGFGYCETGDSFSLSGPERAALGDLTEMFTGKVSWIREPGEGMRLMYHDFGIIRENKELIRHRVFMTRLKPGCEEEYKRRHDGLIEARNGIPDPGPDSNFSIWTAGGYIFGYDEIDTGMETEETPEAHQAAVEWESRQLGIMDWETNDVDWLTGQIHPACIRLAWHL
jgi:L-rhamnose mutarotase